MSRRRSAIYPGERLTTKQTAFVEAVADGLSVTDAARSAGYSGKGPSKTPAVVEAIRQRRDELRRRSAITRDEVLQGFKEAIHDAKLLSDPQAQIAGWREIGKMLGYYEPERKVVELSDKREEALAQLQTLDMEQLMEMAGGEVIDGEFELLEDTR